MTQNLVEVVVVVLKNAVFLVTYPVKTLYTLIAERDCLTVQLKVTLPSPQGIKRLLIQDNKSSLVNDSQIWSCLPCGYWPMGMEGKYISWDLRMALPKY